MFLEFFTKSTFQFEVEALYRYMHYGRRVRSDLNKIQRSL